MRKTLLLFAVLCVTFSCTGSKIAITNNGSSNYTIIIPQNATQTELKASRQMQQFLHRISGAELPILSDTASLSENEIVIGKTNRPECTLVDTTALEQDGFIIFTKAGKLFITGGSRYGTLYGVNSFLDEYLGCRLYSPTAQVVPQNSTIKIPSIISNKQVPEITFRDTYYNETNDSTYIEWHKLSHDTKGGKPEWGSWVHTFDALVPPSQYFKTHPEYYSEINGKRYPQQLCLTNPEVLEICIANLAKQIEANPTAKYWSVSSNDNFGYCQCAECAAIDAAEGSPAGTVIRFVNEVARRFPDKIISTLGYQYSRKAPSITRPDKNVNIMLCNIECSRALPIATDTTSASFCHDMEAWAAVTDNILLWDYVIQFKNLIGPFPNLRTLQPNMRYFADNNVKAIFEQGNYFANGEFSQLRAYLVSKLMWNPNANTDSLILDFTDGYYGKAGKDIREYINLLHDKSEAAAEKMGIFDNPITPMHSYLSPDNLKLYSAIFDRAEKSVSDNPELLLRVKAARLPIDFTLLEQAWVAPFEPGNVFIKDSDTSWHSNAEYIAKLDSFKAMCDSVGVPQLAEWHTTPAAYHAVNMRAATFTPEGHLALGCNVALEPATLKTRKNHNPSILTDGMLGSTFYNANWIGVDTTNFAVIVDLGKPTAIKEISTRFLNCYTDLIFAPYQVEYLVSQDGKSYSSVKTFTNEIDRTNKMKDNIYSADGLNLNAKFVKVKVAASTANPKFDDSVGWGGMTMIDEVIVK